MHMNHKSVLGVLLGVSLVIIGILEVFARAPEARNAVGYLFMILLCIIGIVIMGVVIFRDKEVYERFFLGGIGVMTLVIPILLTILLLPWKNADVGILALIIAIFLAGLFMLLQGIALSRPVKLTLDDFNDPYCPVCDNIFPFANKDDNCPNGCLP